MKKMLLATGLALALVPAVSNASAPTGVGIRVAKTDNHGKPLVGMVFGGESCTRWDNDIEWQCQDLSAYAWTDMSETATTDGITNEIPMRGDGNEKCSKTVGSHYITLYEVTPPAGYTRIPGEITVCMSATGWMTASNTAGRRIRVSKVEDGIQVTFIDRRIGSDKPAPTSGHSGVDIS
ncbi:MAG TPA: hypothetical protein PKK40_08470 [Marmoricola sp.]|nr:hypothetical protein [Marmoricola sp.]